MLPKTPHQRPGSVGFSHWEALGLQARPLWVAPPWGWQTRGSPLWFPPALGRVPAPELCLQGKGLELSQLRGLAALLLPGNRARGGARLQLIQGCPCRAVYTHGGPTPAPRYPRSRFPFQPRASLLRCARSFPLATSLFSADLFSSFCGETLLAAS